MTTKKNFMERFLCRKTVISIFYVALVAALILRCPRLAAQPKADTTSYIQTLDIETGKIDTILIAKGDFEAPNWHPDNYLVLNFRG